MSHLYRETEWLSGSGTHWYSSDIEEIGKRQRDDCWIPAHILGITPTELVKLLVDVYKVDYISYNNNLLLYWWNSQSDMRKWKNFINRKAREKNYII